MSTCSVWACVQVSTCSVWACVQVSTCSVWVCVQVSTCSVWVCVQVSTCSVWACVQVSTGNVWVCVQVSTCNVWVCVQQCSNTIDVRGLAEPRPTPRAERRRIAQMAFLPLVLRYSISRHLTVLGFPESPWFIHCGS